jgi:hypothetical protein
MARGVVTRPELAIMPESATRTGAAMRLALASMLGELM